MPTRHRHFAAASIAAVIFAATSGAAHSQSSSSPRITFGRYAVGFRAVCDTAGRDNAAGEQLLVWYPARQPGARPLRASEYLTESRQASCSTFGASDTEQRAAVAAFAGWIAPMFGAGKEPVGGRMFPNDSATSIERRIAATTMRAFLEAPAASGAFPVFVFAPAGAFEELVLLEAIASHGYIVVTFPHRGIPPEPARAQNPSRQTRHLTAAAEIGRAVSAAKRMPNADSTRVTLMASGSALPGAIWYHATGGRLTALITQEGRYPGAQRRPDAAGPTRPRIELPSDSVPAAAIERWRIPVLAFRTIGDIFDRGVLDSLRFAERIVVELEAGHPNSDGIRRLVYPTDTVATTANDLLGAYVLQFLAYVSERRADASAFFDRTAEANGVAQGLAVVRRIAPLPAASPAPDRSIGFEPPRRAHHSLVYDAANARATLIGGSTPKEGGGSRFFDDLWGFDGARWTLLGASGMQRSGQAVAYDSKRRRVVAFGGYCDCKEENGGRYSDFAELTNGHWTSLGEIPSRPTTDAGLVYDTRRDRLVLFGGAGGQRNMFGDTWEYDGESWKQTATDGPSPRSGFGMAYDEARGRTVLFGGFETSPASSLGDTWEYDGRAWVRVATDGPSPRHASGMTYDSKRHRIVLFGGGGAREAYGDTWAWDGKRWTKLADGGPEPRLLGQLAYDVRRDRIVMFGPYGPNASLIETWEWDGAKWVRLTPPARAHAGMVFDGESRKSILVGGAGVVGGKGNVALDDAWSWDGRRWQRFSRADVKRVGHSLVFDSKRRRVMVVAGSNAQLPTQYGKGIAALGARGWQEVTNEKLPEREGAAIAFDPIRQRTVVFGGFRLDTIRGDTQEFDGTAWRRVPVIGPSPRHAAVMAFHAPSGKLVLFGGSTRDSVARRSRLLGDTWTFDGAAWTLADTLGPAPRIGASAVYDEARREIVLFGGSVQGAFDGSTWAWNGARWAQRAAIGPSPRAVTAMSYDAVRRVVVLFGGRAADGEHDDTWEWDGERWVRVA